MLSLLGGPGLGVGAPQPSPLLLLLLLLLLMRQLQLRPQISSHLRTDRPGMKPCSAFVPFVQQQPSFINAIATIALSHFLESLLQMSAQVAPSHIYCCEHFGMRLQSWTASIGSAVGGEPLVCVCLAWPA